MMVPFSSGGIMQHLPTLSNELRDTVSITFPTAESLWRSAGGAQAPRAVASDMLMDEAGKPAPHETNGCAVDTLPSIAVSFPYQSDDVQAGVDKYNSMIYYISVACDLRYSTQVQNHRARGGV